MDTSLLDAAFRLVSHSIATQEKSGNPPKSDEQRLAELRGRFPQADAKALEEACARARALEETAIEIAAATRANSGTFDMSALEVRCPGFSAASYWLAVNDGWELTR